MPCSGASSIGIVTIHSPAGVRAAASRTASTIPATEARPPMAIPPRAFSPSRSICGCASKAPGVTVRPAASRMRVSRPRRRRISASSPTAAIRPSRTANASASGRAGSRVRVRALWRISSGSAMSGPAVERAQDRRTHGRRQARPPTSSPDPLLWADEGRDQRLRHSGACAGLVAARIRLRAGAVRIGAGAAKRRLHRRFLGYGLRHRREDGADPGPARSFLRHAADAHGLGLRPHDIVDGCSQVPRSHGQSFPQRPARRVVEAPVRGLRRDRGAVRHVG